MNHPRPNILLFTHHLHRKTYAYEGSARIPLLIRCPAGLDLPSGAFKQVVGLQAVMPAILEVAGVPVPDSVTGTSLLQAVRGGQWREYLHGEHSPCYSLEEAMHYLTDGCSKYIWFSATGEEQFFDLVHVARSAWIWREIPGKASAWPSGGSG